MVMGGSMVVGCDRQIQWWVSRLVMGKFGGGRVGLWMGSG